MEHVKISMIPKSSLSICHVTQNDNGREVSIDFEDYTLTGAEDVSLVIRKPDGTRVETALENTASDFVIWSSVPSECDVVGLANCEIKAEDDGVVLYSASFNMNIEADPYGSDVTTLSATGNPCTFSTDLADALVSLTADIVCGGGGGTPSTPIPIVGHSELNLTRCGKNFVSDYEVNAGRTIYQDCLWLDCELVPNTTYTLSLDGTNGNRFYTNGELFTNAIYKDISGRTFVEVTTKSNISKSTTSQYTNGGGWRVLKNAKNQDEDNTFTNVQLELGSTATEYEAYNGSIYNIAFTDGDDPLTVYGGKLNVTTGELTITHGYVDLGSLEWIYTSGEHSRFETTTILSNAKIVAGNIIPNALCSIYKMESMNNVYLHSEDIIIGFDNYVWVYDSSAGTDANAFKSAVNGQMLAYELATPIVIDVPSISPSAVVGTNNIVSDGGGDVNVTYIKKV